MRTDGDMVYPPHQPSAYTIENHAKAARIKAGGGCLGASGSVGGIGSCRRAR